MMHHCGRALASIALILSMVGSVTGSPYTAVAAGQESSAATGARMADDTKPERVCRREKQIGSNIPVTVCRTRAQMDAEEAAARREVERGRVR
jgi:hypothetical protein